MQRGGKRGGGGGGGESSDFWCENELGVSISKFWDFFEQREVGIIMCENSKSLGQAFLMK